MIVELYFFTDENGQMCGPYINREDCMYAYDVYGLMLKEGVQSINLETHAKIQEIHRNNTDLRNQLHSITA